MSCALRFFLVVVTGTLDTVAHNATAADEACPASSLLQATHFSSVSNLMQKAHASALHEAALNAGLPWTLADAQRHSEQLRASAGPNSSLANDSWLQATSNVGLMAQLQAKCKGLAADGDQVGRCAAPASQGLALMRGAIKGGMTVNTALQQTFNLGISVAGMFCPICGMVAGFFGGVVFDMFSPNSKNPADSMERALKAFGQGLLDIAQKRIEAHYFRNQLRTLKVDLDALLDSLELVPSILMKSTGLSEQELAQTRFSFHLNMLHETTRVLAQMKATAAGAHAGKWCYYLLPLVAPGVMHLNTLYLQVAAHVEDTDGVAKSHVLKKMTSESDAWARWATDCESLAHDWIDSELNSYKRKFAYGDIDCPIGGRCKKFEDMVFDGQVDMSKVMGCVNNGIGNPDICTSGHYWSFFRQVKGSVTEIVKLVKDQACQPTSLIKNGGFDGTMDFWSCFSRLGAPGVQAAAHGRCHAHHNYQGHDWTAHLHTYCLSTEGGVRQLVDGATLGAHYKLKFKAFPGEWSGKGMDVVKVDINSMGGVMTHEFPVGYKSTGAVGWSDLEFDFMAKGINFNIIFHADQGECIDIDDVVLEQC